MMTSNHFFGQFDSDLIFEKSSLILASKLGLVMG